MLCDNVFCTQKYNIYMKLEHPFDRRSLLNGELHQSQANYVINNLQSDYHSIYVNWFCK